jgi:CubicO group peptidase (beta-lactamase class C family)
MTRCAAAYDRIKDRSDVASPHIVVEGKLRTVPVQSLNVVGPAGTINCSINGMAQWLKMHLAAGKAPDGRPLFKVDRQREMWSVTTPQVLNETLAALNHTHFRGYGLGWGLEDEFGHKLVWHTGGVPGSVTWVGMVPELNLGVLVFTNQQDGLGMEAMAHTILDAYLGAPQRDWVALVTDYKKKMTAAAQAETAQQPTARIPPPLSLAAYAGRYHDAWRGDATVKLEGQQLFLTISRTKELAGKLEPFAGNVFIVHWDNRSLDADAYVRFSQGFGDAIEGMTLKAVSPETDFSFDFQDLDFHRMDKD